MRRLAATVGIDLRLQWRNGFYLASVVVALALIALLRWLPDAVAQWLLPVLVLEAVLVNGFYFMAALLLLELGEGSAIAQAVTPLRRGEYLTAKLLTLTGLSLLEGLVIASAVFGFGPALLPVALGIVLAMPLFALAGVVLVLRHASLNAFLLPSALYTFALSLPILGVLGLGGPDFYGWHPLSGPLALMHGSWPDGWGGWVHAVAYPLAWLPPAWWLANRALHRARSA